MDGQNLGYCRARGQDTRAPHASTTSWAVPQPYPTRKAHSSPSFPVVSGKHLGLNVQLQRAEAFHARFLRWDDKAPGPADVFCLFPLASSSNISMSIEDPGGLRYLEEGGEIHHETGIPQGATSPAPWASSSAGRKQGAEQRHMLQHAGAWGTSLLSQASYCQQLNKLIGRIFPRRGRRFLI